MNDRGISTDKINWKNQVTREERARDVRPPIRYHGESAKAISRLQMPPHTNAARLLCEKWDQLGQTRHNQQRSTTRILQWWAPTTWYVVTTTS